MKWWLILGAGAIAGDLAGGHFAGRLVGFVVRELLRGAL